MGWMIRGVGLVAAATVILAICDWAFERQIGHLFNGLDGAYMLTHVRQFLSLTTPILGFTANPLQGLGDIWFNFNVWLSLEYRLAHLIFGVGAPQDTAFQAFVYATYAALLFAATAVFVLSLRERWSLALASGWVCVLIAFPVFGEPLLYPIVGLQPNIASTIAESLLILSVFGMIGRQSPSGRVSISGTIFLIGLMAAVSIHLILVAPTVVILCVPLFVIFGGGLLLGAVDRAEIKWKITAALAVSAAIAACGIIQYGVGLFQYTNPYFFSDELENTRRSWYFVSLVFHDELHGPGGPLLVGIGLVGLLVGAFAAKRRIAWIARAGLFYAFLIFAIGGMTVLIDFWKGPSPLYFEILLWPVYTIFALRLPWALADFVHARLQVFGNNGRGGFWSTRQIGPVLALMLPAGLVLLSFSFVDISTKRAFHFPPSLPPIVQDLQEEIGLSLGQPVRGRVVVLQQVDGDGPVNWFDLHVADDRRNRAIGNDVHTVGLWYHGIPTVLAYSPSISPSLFLAAKRLLAAPGDQQIRSALVLRRANASALAALGVTHVVSDTPLSEPFEQIREQATSDDERLYLYRVPGAIAGWASPREVRVEEDFLETLDGLAADDFVPRETAYLDPRNAAALGDGLTPARDVAFTLAPGGFRLTAKGGASTLLVIPFLYSHCWQFVADDPALAPRDLIRVNGIETGIVFGGTLNGLLRYRTGPFEGRGCRLDDSALFKQLYRN